MSTVAIRDHALWAAHIEENDALKEKILSLSQGASIELNVDGWSGTWLKMNDGKNGRPTPGLKAVGDARVSWHAMQDSRGTKVPIREV
jgi:hypothetical protein